MSHKYVVPVWQRPTLSVLWYSVFLLYTIMCVLSVCPPLFRFLQPSGPPCHQDPGRVWWAWVSQGDQGVVPWHWVVVHMLTYIHTHTYPHTPSIPPPHTLTGVLWWLHCCRPPPVLTQPDVCECARMHMEEGGVSEDLWRTHLCTAGTQEETHHQVRILLNIIGILLRYCLKLLAYCVRAEY